MKTSSGERLSRGRIERRHLAHLAGSGPLGRRVAEPGELAKSLHRFRDDRLVGGIELKTAVAFSFRKVLSRYASSSCGSDQFAWKSTGFQTGTLLSTRE